MNTEISTHAARAERDLRLARSSSSEGGWAQRSKTTATRRRRVAAGWRRQPPVKQQAIDWKDVRTLRPFLDDAGRIRPRRKTGASVKMQRAIARAVKRARFMALLPYTSEHIRTAREEE